MSIKSRLIKLESKTNKEKKEIISYTVSTITNISQNYLHTFKNIASGKQWQI